MSSSWSTRGPECPSCGFTFTPDDSIYYTDSYTEDTCPECEAKFKVEVHHRVSWACELVSSSNQPCPCDKHPNNCMHPYCAGCTQAHRPQGET